MTSSSNIKGFRDSKPIYKKVIRLGADEPPAMLVVLHESIVAELAIDEECWLEQTRERDGIFLRVSRQLADNQTEDSGV